MTTYVNFTPSTNALFQFQATLDGNLYNVVITWSLAGQRYYINVYALDGTLIVAKPLVGSPLDYDINLVWGLFTNSTLIYRAPSRQFGEEISQRDVECFGEGLGLTAGFDEFGKESGVRS